MLYTPHQLRGLRIKRTSTIRYQRCTDVTKPTAGRSHASVQEWKATVIRCLNRHLLGVAIKLRPRFYPQNAHTVRPLLRIRTTNRGLELLSLSDPLQIYSHTCNASCQWAPPWIHICRVMRSVTDDHSSDGGDRDSRPCAVVSDAHRVSECNWSPTR